MNLPPSPDRGEVPLRYAVVYGAGNIGRGFIAPLFVRAGYEVTFIDTAENIVNALCEKGSYPVRLLSNEEDEEIWIEGINAVHGSNEQLVTDCIAKADIMATAVGVRALPFITPIMAAGFKKRFPLNSAPLNIIVCENLIDGDKYLAELISRNLKSEEIKQMKKSIGFVEASIGRMIPVQTPQMQEGNILRICCEKYAFLPVNKDAFIGKIPEIEGMIPFANFGFFIQRKLFIHNMGHAVIAYLGLLCGDQFISDAIQRADLIFIAQNAMFESASALARKFNVPLQDMMDHIRDLLCRFNNRLLNDTCARVGADIKRKLGPGDRFTGAIVCCKEQDVLPAFISIGAAAALSCLVKENGLDQTEKNAVKVLTETSGLESHSAEARLILDMYNRITQGSDLKELLLRALFLGNKSGVV